MSTATDIDYAGATDQQLLGRYRRKHDQQAFAELVSRYHGLVLGLSHRMLGCSHSAEDVLQATFLVLARDAHKIHNQDALASWLYGVAFRISARHVKRRANRNVSILKDEVMVADDPLEKLCQQFEQQAAFEELHRLPEKTRAPMVMRYLQGKSNAEVAKSLAMSEAAVEGRLRRGRNQLRLRLAKQGVTFAAAAAALEATKNYAHGGETSELVAQTVEVCLAKGTVGDPSGIEVFHMAEEEIWKMATATVMKHVLAVTLTTIVIAAGWSLAGNVVVNAQDQPGEVVLAGADTRTEDQQPGTTTKIDGTTTPRYYYSAARPQGGQPPATDPTDQTDPFAKVSESTNSAQTPPASGQPENAKHYYYYSVPKGQQIAKSAGYSFEQYSDAEVKIKQKLSQATQAEFLDAPLAEVMRYLADAHDIQIVLDQVGLASEGVTADLEITLELKSIRLQSALNLILEPHQLTAIVKDEVLLITGVTRADSLTSPRVYEVNQSWEMSDDELIKVITATVDPDTWDEVGGPSSIVGIQGGLVINTSDRTHEKVNKLLGQLDRLRP